MIKDLGEIEKLLTILRSQGVSAFKWNGLEIALDPSFIIPHQGIPLTDPSYPTQSELDRAVNLPVGGLDDPFLNYNEQVINEDQPS